MEQKRDKQIDYMDILKGLGIIAVVIGHSGSPILKYVYLYHMALFFFISGYFYKEEYTDKPFEFIKKRVKSLYLPFVLYELIFILLRNIFIQINIYNTKSIDKIESVNQLILLFKNVITFNTTGEHMLGAIWFLHTLFYVNIAFLLIKFILKKFKVKNEFQVFSIMFAIYVLGFYMLNNNIDIRTMINPHNRKVINLLLNLFYSRNFIIVFIYYLGSLYRQYEEKIKLNIFLVISCIIILVYNGKMTGGIDIAFSLYGDPVYFLANSLLGIYVNLYIAKLSIFTNNKILKFIGKNSMIIMIFHFLAFKFVSLIQVLIYKVSFEQISNFPVFIWNNGWWIVYSMVGVIMPTLVIYILKVAKNKLIHLHI